jgi:hypothetical protein
MCRTCARTVFGEQDWPSRAIGNGKGLVVAVTEPTGEGVVRLPGEGGTTLAVLATAMRSRLPGRKPVERSGDRGLPCSSQRWDTAARQHARGRELLGRRGNTQLSAGRAHPRSTGGDLRPHSRRRRTHALERHRRAGSATGLPCSGRFRALLRRSRRAHGRHAPWPAGHEPDGGGLREVRSASGGAAPEQRTLINRTEPHSRRRGLVTASARKIRCDCGVRPKAAVDCVLTTHAPLRRQGAVLV